MEADAREANYLEELAEIKAARKWLRNEHNKGRVKRAQMQEGLRLLTEKTKGIERRHVANVIPEYVQQYTPPVKTRGRGNWRETPRKDAKAKGLTFYISPLPCHRGHEKPKRYVSTGQCAACHTIWTAKKKANQTEYRSQI